MDQAGLLEDTPLLPQQVKSVSIPGFALLCLRSRKYASSAFHTVFSTPGLIQLIPRICGCSLEDSGTDLLAGFKNLYYRSLEILPLLHL